MLNKVNKRTKLMTSGWIRKQEKMLKLHNVPTAVTSMCILYTREDEIFDKISDNGIKINTNKKKVIKDKMDDDDYNNNYGIIEIESNSNDIIQWNLKVNMNQRPYEITIGITNVEDVNNAFEELNDDAVYYMFWSNTCISASGWKYYGSRGQYGGCFCDGDLVSLKLNLMTRQISLIVNGKHEGIAFKNICKSSKIKYKLFVSLKHIGDSVEIIDFIRE